MGRGEDGEGINVCCGLKGLEFRGRGGGGENALLFNAKVGSPLIP